MNQNHIIVAIACLVSFGATLIGQEVSKTTNDFVGSSPERKRELARTLAQEERNFVVAELNRMLADPDFGKTLLVESLAYLGDEQALQQLVQEFIAHDGASPGTLAAVQEPRIIEMVAAEFYREEPMSLGASDVIVIPRSYRAAELATEILAGTPVFSKEVREWAGIVRRLTFVERRDLIRPWWRANEKVFREKNYQAVQPGPPPPRVPPILTGRVVPAPEPRRIPPGASATPLSEKAPPLSRGPWFGYALGAALVLLLVGALYISTRKGS